MVESSVGQEVGIVESVYFTSLEVRNVRCFGRKQVLDLTDKSRRPARWTLILETGPESPG